MAYAEKTKVPVERSRAQLEGLLRRYGCTGFVSGWQDNVVLIGFAFGEPAREVKFVLVMPSREDEVVRYNNRGYEKTEKQMQDTMAQEERRRWRALNLVVQAKLEAVESGIATFDQEFLPYIVLPGGQTVAEVVQPKIAECYEKGGLAPLLKGLPGPPA